MTPEAPTSGPESGHDAGHPSGAVSVGNPIAAPAIEPAEEDLHPGSGEGHGEALTFSFSDPRAGVHGAARLGVSGEGAQRAASALVVLFDAGGLAAVRADSSPAPAPDAAGWESVSAAGLSTATLEPLRGWRLGFEGGSEGGFELHFEAMGAGAASQTEGPVARLGGMRGYEHVCRVSGTVRTASAERSVSGLGQRGHAWGAPDWSRLELARTLGVWSDEGPSRTYAALRPAGARAHAEEVVEAWLLEGDPPAPRALDEARLSTTYDGDGHHHRAGLELWEGPDSDFPRRWAGEAVCGTSLDLGRLTLQTAFFRWHLDSGRTATGRYDVLRRA